MATAATMTDGARRVPVPAIAAGLFCLILTYLALQVRAGHDPAIGAGQQQAAQPRQVIVRKVVVRRVVAAAAPRSAQPAAKRSAPAAAAPAPAAAPPAPAPVVSRGS
jgi:hypothetical protein